MSTVQQPKQEEYENDDNTDVMIQNHLDWSDKQRRILTANGKMEEYYSTQNGYSFTNNELPHYYIQNKIKDDIDNNDSGKSKSIFDIFHQWKIEEQEDVEQKKPETNYISPIFGVWKRTLFYSTNTYDYTTNDIEYTFNIQTNTLFIDLRIPKSRNQIFSFLQQRQQHETKQILSLNDMDGQQLRLYARQHIFAGYTRVVTSKHNKDDTNERSSSSSITFPYCATRFHCIDWNYIGTSRSRPNKWYIELPTTSSSHTNSIDTNTNNDKHHTPNTITPPTSKSTNIQQWKEWAYATNEYKQHYYCEYWERYSSTHMTTTTATSKVNNDDMYLILRIQSSDNDTTIKEKDGIIIIYNDQVMYCIDRCSDIYPFHKNNRSSNNSITSLVALIDDLILQQNDLETARSWLTIQGGHGQWIKDASSPKQVSSSNHNHNPTNNNNNGAWILDHCIEFWLQGQSLFNNTLHTNNNDSNITITGTSIDDCKIIWKNHIWTIFDTNIQSIDTVRKLILHGPQ